MAKPLQYSDVPTYVGHIIPQEDVKTFTVDCGSGKTFTFTLNNIGMTVNGNQYYDKAKVDELLSKLEQDLKGWANSRFKLIGSM